MSQLQTQGYAVVEDLLPAALCEELVYELNFLLIQHEDRIRHSDDGSRETRLFGLERGSRLIRDAAARNDLLTRTARAYLRAPFVPFVIGSKLRHFEGGLPPADADWYRDPPSRPLKAILYLNDVTPQDGPLTVVSGSKKVDVPARPDHPYRLADADVQPALRHHGLLPTELSGRAGTCILLDPANLHRGKPLDGGGMRYALITYLLPRSFLHRLRRRFRWRHWMV